MKKGIEDQKKSKDFSARATQRTNGTFEKLCQLILDQNVREGTQIPGERALAAKLKAGRPAVREAIKALSMLDVLESRHGDGTYIKSLAGLSAGWGVKVKKIGENFDIIELLEVRRIFEPRAAALAAARANARQLDEMEREIRAQAAHLDDYDAFAQHDFSFHDAIIRSTGNGILCELARVLAPLLVKSRQVTIRTTPDIPRILDQHRKIFEVIRGRDPELSAQAMEEHLRVVSLDLISQNRR